MDRTDRSLLCAKYDEIMEARKWIREIPKFTFNPKYEVQIIPPFGGSLVRFQTFYGDNNCSIYLDGYNHLGSYDGPYWEIYPVSYGIDDMGCDVFRCGINETKILLTVIEISLADLPFSYDNSDEILEWIWSQDFDLFSEEVQVAYKLKWS